MENQPLTPELWLLDRVYNTLMTNLSTRRFKAVGKSKWINFQRDKDLGRGVVSYSGYDLNVEITNGWRPYINIMGN